ncbi:Ldh family oxidoreductase [Salibacterium aidingense]|uniref:Ldh family oxidoreductase n=1 Tax=Salibacterium aidingense TaxID=384933 RepID=UPI003BEB0AE5
MDELKVHVEKHELEEFVNQIFLAVGLDKEQASIIANHLVLADLRGMDSHGVSRVETYVKRFENGLINKKLDAKTECETVSSMLINGMNGSGIVLATKGIEAAVRKAKDTGVAIVGINNSEHCGMLGAYTMYAAENDCIALATTNSPPNMAPWGGRERFFGTNPFSYGIPTGEEKNIVFDMATSVVARGKIILAQKNNQQIPIGWAISKEGKPTTDPNEAMEGLVLPVGGAKGYGITFLVETLSSLLTGATFGPHLPDYYKDAAPLDVGQCFVVFRADLFQSLKQFKDRIDQMVSEIKEVPLMEGVSRIYLPGEIEMEKTKDRLSKGIPISQGIVNELLEIGRHYKVSNTLMKKEI